MRYCKMRDTNEIHLADTQRDTYLLEYSDKQSQNSEHVVVRGEGCGHAHNDRCPVTEEKNRFAAKFVRQTGTDHSTDHHAHSEYCLCEVLEISAIADQVPLQVRHRCMQWQQTTLHS